MNAKLKLILTSFVFILFVLFFCEFLIYYVMISLCYWPTMSSSHNQLDSKRVETMVLSDTHLLGRLRGHWFDKLRREWQMKRSFQTSMHLLSPEVVIILGDVFDEGQWASDTDFDTYVNRFNDMFAISPDKHKMIVVVGNHDIGFHYWTDKYLRQRFEKAFNRSDVDIIEISNGVHFVTINSIALEGDNCYLCVGAVEKIKSLGKQLRKDNIQPILLMHFPLFRDNELICKESDSSTLEDKSVKNKERLDCISREATDFVLNELNPRLVLTGHSHHSCVVVHEWDKPNVKRVVEWTVASFSWRNIKTPSFLLLTLTSNHYSISKCFLPNENIVFLIYLICFLFLIIHNIRCFLINYFTAKHKSN